MKKQLNPAIVSVLLRFLVLVSVMLLWNAGKSAPLFQTGTGNPKVSQQTIPKRLHLTLETRDASTNEVSVTTENVESKNVGVVIVDPWNYHWCMTACERVGAMVPRWNKALEAARRSGMTIVWVPSDVIGAYSGYPQRERALGQLLMEVPVVKEMPKAKFTATVGKCMCGPGINCKVNYGQDAMNPSLILGDDDYIASSTEEVYTALQKNGITHVIYMGLHTNMCLYGKPGALKYLWQTGLKCMVARDINDAFTNYDPAKGFNPDMGTQQIDEDLERAGIPLINVVNEWRKAGMWNDQWMVETVRIAPWGKKERPYLFEKETIITLTTPWLDGVEIRYTTDGSAPGPGSAMYKEPFKISNSTQLKTAAFRGGKQVTLPTDAYYVLLPPEPPKPSIYLDDLKFILDPYDQVNKGFVWEPKIGKSYNGLPLHVRGNSYEKGLGFLAPSGARYKIMPEYDRFVAKAGIDDNLLEKLYGNHLAQYPGVIFKIFIDGNLVAESPVMRISQESWRFDVKIPGNSRYINLVCMAAGNRQQLDLGNWVDAGFITK